MNQNTKFMSGRFAILRHGGMILTCLLLVDVLILVPVLISFIKWGTDNGLLLFCLILLALLTLCEILGFGRLIALTLSAVRFSEEGIHFCGTFLSSNTIPWDKCTRLNIVLIAGRKGYYNHYMLCFGTRDAQPWKGKRGILGIPKDTSKMICIAYSEFAWAIAEKYLPPETLALCHLKRHEIV
ncbi:MAG: hypothetical protein FWE69_08355 [Clostridiales bacterium]|nr:hypothetical protein [Clostridiales bacterium]